MAWTECVRGKGGSLMSLLGGPSAAPLVPSPVPVSTYQEHEHDGNLEDVVQLVARLLPKPAPAKVGAVSDLLRRSWGTTADSGPGASSVTLPEAHSPGLNLPQKQGGWSQPH